MSTDPELVPTGTLARPAVHCGPDYHDWTVDAGYYGRADPAVLAWVVEAVVPNTEAAARELAARAAEITAALTQRKAPKHVGLAAAVFPYSLRRFRLRAERTPAGWAVAEYDYHAFDFTLPPTTGVSG